MLYLYMFILQVMPFYGTNVKSLELNKIGEEEESKKLY